MTSYTTGTITLTNGSPAVTGTGTGWQTALIAGGVIYPQAAGNPLPIASVDGNTAITAATAWIGESGTYPYALQRQDDANRVIANAVALAQYIQRLDSEALSALAGLTPAPDRLPYFNGSGSATLLALTAFARTLLEDANASSALSTLGVSPYAKTLLDDADASAMRVTLGAQKNLGYAPLNKTGDEMTGQLTNRAVRGSGDFYNDAYYAVLQGRGNVSGDNYRTFFGITERSGQYLASYIALLSYGGYNEWTFREGGHFNANGTITGASKSFLIDHPLDPFNRDLTFASTESPHYGIEAWGVARLEGGRAAVDIDAASHLTPGTWAALAQNTLVAALQNQEGFARLRPGPIDGSSFEIIADNEACSDLVSWHVIADRADPVVKTFPNADPETGLLIPEAEKEDAI